MKKQIRILMLTIVLILISTLAVNVVNAADATVSLNLSKTEVVAGDTFTVTLNVACEEGINGLQGKVSYDEDKLEIVKIDVDTSKWMNIGEEPEIAILHNSSNTETSADIVKVTLKVKETAEVGTAKVTFSDIVIDSDAATNSNKNIGTKEVEVSIKEEQASPEEKTLTEIEVTTPPTKTKYTAGEKFDKTGMKVTAKYSDGSSKEIEGYTYSPARELKTSDKEIKISYTEGSITKTAKVVITVASGVDNGNSNDKGTTSGNKIDKTTAEKEYPKTGAKTVILPLLLIAILVIVSYVGYRKSREI